MHAIGIRAAPTQVHYTILRDGPTEAAVVDVARVVVPAALDVPRQFRHIRTTFLDILNEYNVTRAGIRLAEASARNQDTFRIGLEAVLQEMLDSSPVERYHCLRLNSMAARVGVPLADMKPLIDGATKYPGVERWGEMKPVERESLLAAAAALRGGR